MAGEVIGQIIRAEGGAVRFDLKADIDVEELAAIMIGVSDFAKSLGIHPGELSRSYMALEMARKFPGAEPVDLGRLG